MPFLEALIVAAGMPLRALAGAALAGVWPSPFLMGCAYLLALFLVVGKRQWEFHHSGDEPRPSTGRRSPPIAAEGLDYLFIVTAHGDRGRVRGLQRRAGDPGALRRPVPRVTVPFVVLGIARYVRLVYRRGGGGNPTRALLTDDPWLLAIVIGWVGTAGWIIYGH